MDEISAGAPWEHHRLRIRIERKNISKSWSKTSPDFFRTNQSRGATLNLESERWCCRKESGDEFSEGFLITSRSWFLKSTSLKINGFWTYKSPNWTGISSSKPSFWVQKVNFSGVHPTLENQSQRCVPVDHERSRKLHVFGWSLNSLKNASWTIPLLGGGFKYFLFSPLLGENFQFDEYFQMGWNHQLD